MDLGNFDWSAHLHTVAWHDKPGHNVAVPGVGVFGRNPDDVIVGAGVYRNSNPGVNISNYVFAGYQPWSVQGVKIGAVAGAVDGYKSGKVEPLAGAFFSKPFVGGEAHVLVTPPVGDKPTVVQLSFTKPF